MKPEWMISDDEDSDTMDDKKNPKETTSKISADSVKLGNLLKRHRVYGDITQNATESQLERLLVNISENIIDKLAEILGVEAQWALPHVFLFLDFTRQQCSQSY